MLNMTNIAHYTLLYQLPFVFSLYVLNEDNYLIDSQQRKEIEAQINRELEETRQDIDSLSDLVKPIAPDNAIGRLSRMEAIGAKSINEAALARAKEKLEQLKSVLADLDDPDFGLCIECDKEIPIKRIMLMPGSRLCVQCAGNLERGS